MSWGLGLVLTGGCGCEIGAIGAAGGAIGGSPKDGSCTTWSSGTSGARQSRVAVVATSSSPRLRAATRTCVLMPAFCAVHVNSTGSVNVLGRLTFTPGW